MDFHGDRFLNYLLVTFVVSGGTVPPQGISLMFFS